MKYNCKNYIRVFYREGPSESGGGDNTETNKKDVLQKNRELFEKMKDLEGKQAKEIIATIDSLTNSSSKDAVLLYLRNKLKTEGWVLRFGGSDDEKQIRSMLSLPVENNPIEQNSDGENSLETYTKKLFTQFVAQGGGSKKDILDWISIQKWQAKSNEEYIKIQTLFAFVNADTGGEDALFKNDKLDITSRKMSTIRIVLGLRDLDSKKIEDYKSKNPIDDEIRKFTELLIESNRRLMTGEKYENEFQLLLAQKEEEYKEVFGSSGKGKEYMRLLEVIKGYNAYFDSHPEIKKQMSFSTSKFAKLFTGGLGIKSATKDIIAASIKEYTRTGEKIDFDKERTLFEGSPLEQLEMIQTISENPPEKVYDGLIDKIRVSIKENKGLDQKDLAEYVSTIEKTILKDTFRGKEGTIVNAYISKFEQMRILINNPALYEKGTGISGWFSDLFKSDKEIQERDKKIQKFLEQARMGENINGVIGESGVNDFRFYSVNEMKEGIMNTKVPEPGILNAWQQYIVSLDGKYESKLFGTYITENFAMYIKGTGFDTEATKELLPQKNKKDFTDYLETLTNKGTEQTHETINQEKFKQKYPTLSKKIEESGYQLPESIQLYQGEINQSDLITGLITKNKVQLHEVGNLRKIISRLLHEESAENDKKIIDELKKIAGITGYIGNEQVFRERFSWGWILEMVGAGENQEPMRSKMLANYSQLSSVDLDIIARKIKEAKKGLNPENPEDKKKLDIITSIENILKLRGANINQENQETKGKSLTDAQFYRMAKEPPDEQASDSRKIANASSEPSQADDKSIDAYIGTIQDKSIFGKYNLPSSAKELRAASLKKERQTAIQGLKNSGIKITDDSDEGRLLLILIETEKLSNQADIAVFSIAGLDSDIRESLTKNSYFFENISNEDKGIYEKIIKEDILGSKNTPTNTASQENMQVYSYKNSTDIPLNTPIPISDIKDVNSLNLGTISKTAEVSKNDNGTFTISDKEERHNPVKDIKVQELAQKLQDTDTLASMNAYILVPQIELMRTLIGQNQNLQQLSAEGADFAQKKVQLIRATELLLGIDLKSRQDLPNRIKNISQSGSASISNELMRRGVFNDGGTRRYEVMRSYILESPLRVEEMTDSELIDVSIGYEQKGKILSLPELERKKTIENIRTEIQKLRTQLKTDEKLTPERIKQLFQRGLETKITHA